MIRPWMETVSFCDIVQRSKNECWKTVRNRGKSAVLYTHLLSLLTGLITDCAPLVLIRLII